MTAKQVGYVIVVDPAGRALGRQATIEETQGKICLDCRKPVDDVRHQRCTHGKFGHHVVQITVSF